MSAYDELVVMTGGDEQTARALLDGLRQLREFSPDPQLRRFADDVIAGRTSLREVARSESYEAILSRPFHGLTRWRDHLDRPDAGR